MELTTCNKYDEEIEDPELLLDVGRHLKLLSYYKELLPIRRALIPIGYELYGINVFHDGSINAESVTSYILTAKTENNQIDNL